MTTLDELIQKEKDLSFRTELEERLAIVEHKIKFMDKVNLCILDTEGHPNITLTSLTQIAGAVLSLNPMGVDYVIVYQQGRRMVDLLSAATGILNADWPASQNDKVFFLADCYQLSKADDSVAMVEDIAEILHPGQFIFGFEGDKWIRFTV